MEGQRSNAGDEGVTSESFGVPDSTILGGCPFNGPLSGMKYPTHTKSTTRHCIVVRSRSRSCGGGDPA